MGGWESEEETCGSRCKRRGTAAGTCLAVHGTVAGVRHVGRAFVVCTPESPRARCVQGVFRETRSIVLGATLATHDRQF